MPQPLQKLPYIVNWANCRFDFDQLNQDQKDLVSKAQTKLQNLASRFGSVVPFGTNVGFSTAIKTTLFGFNFLFLGLKTATIPQPESEPADNFNTQHHNTEFLRLVTDALNAIKNVKIACTSISTSQTHSCWSFGNYITNDVSKCIELLQTFIDSNQV